MKLPAGDKKWMIDHETLFNLLQEGERINITIKGNSMLPFIVAERDRITLVKATASSLRKGRVVVAHVSDKTYYLHRIARIDGDVVTLRGDGNPYSRESCHVSSILAEAVALERKGKIYTESSVAWKAVQKLWPSNPFLRRFLLFVWKKFFR